jgi:hypothetical protein
MSRSKINLYFVDSILDGLTFLLTKLSFCELTDFLELCAGLSVCVCVYICNGIVNLKLQTFSRIYLQTEKESKESLFRVGFC